MPICRYVLNTFTFRRLGMLCNPLMEPLNSAPIFNSLQKACSVQSRLEYKITQPTADQKGIRSSMSSSKSRRVNMAKSVATKPGSRPALVGHASALSVNTSSIINVLIM